MSTDKDTPRLRTSCDRCQAAKVKCSRVKPSCWRCSQSGQQCVYSPFRRTGRPRKILQTSPTAHSSIPDDGEEASCPQNEAQRRHNDSEWHQRQQPQQQQQQQHHGDYSFTREMDTALAPSRLWQDSDLPRSYNDLMLDLETFDAQDITPDSSEDLVPNMTLEGTALPRNISDNSIHSSFASLPSWSSGLENWPTANNTPPDFPAAVSPSAMFPGEMLASWDDSTSKSNTATEPDLSLTTNSDQPSERPASLLQINNQSLAMPGSHTHSLFAQPQRMSIDSTTAPESTMLGFAQAGSHAGPSNGRKCYKAVTTILARLNENDLEGEGASLDKLLGLGRELQHTTKRVLACRRCMENRSNQTMIMLVFMALERLLSLFEKQRDAVAAPSAVLELPQFLRLDKALLVGNFTVDNKMKTVCLRQLVLGFLENHSSISSQLERQVDLVLKGVYRRMAKEMAVDIGRRASFLRGWLRLSS
jgi:hypothetical protein